MDPQSLLFVLLVIAIGGFSAYLADILGYKIGKKRLSIKRIRPKYIARISVVIAGMLIPIITMLLLYGVSSTFRTWITKGSQIVREIEQKQRNIDKINQQLVATETTKAKLENLKAITDDQLKKSKVELSQQEKTLTELKKSVSEAKSRADSAKREQEAALARLAPIQNKLGVKQNELDAKQKEFQAADARFKDADSKYKSADSKYLDTVKRYNETSTKNLRLTSDNADLTKSNDEIKKTSDSLQAMITEINKDISALKTQKIDADSATKTAYVTLANATKQLESLQVQLANERASALGFETYSRTKPITFGRGEELARATVPGQASKSDATSIYRNLLRRAKLMATERGAKPSEVYPFTGPAGSILIDKNNFQLSEDDVEAFYTTEIRKALDDQVLIVSASYNRFAGEPVTLAFELYPNPIVFRKGEIITESRIDGRTSEIEVLTAIREFLRTFVNTKARNRKMIPVKSRDGESFGEFTQNQLLSAVAKAKAVTRSARLVAVARLDTRAGDPLEIELEVR